MPSDSIGFCVAITRNGSGSAVRLAADRHLALLHRLEQRALHLRRRAVDLVGEQEVGEHGPERDLELAELLVEDPRPDDVGGDEVGRELDPLELAADRLGERLHGHRLGEPGDALDEEMAAREQRDDHPLEQGVLADDDALHLVERPARAMRRVWAADP